MNPLASELLEALQRIMRVHCPLTGDPTLAELVEFWEYEKTQGRGEADAQLFALAAIAKAHGSSGKTLRSFLDAAAAAGITHLPSDFGEKLADSEAEFDTEIEQRWPNAITPTKGFSWQVKALRLAAHCRHLERVIRGQRDELRRFDERWRAKRREDIARVQALIDAACDEPGDEDE